MNHKRGSQWAKWDLHVHTPASIEQHYGGESEEVWERYIRDIENLPPEFKVLGINDYLFVDGYERLLREKNSGRMGNIDLLLPVIELRIDKFGGVVKKDVDGTFSKTDWSRVNLHVIFDQISPDLIRQQFLSGLVQSYNLIPESDEFKGRWQAIITRDSLIELGQMIIDTVPEGQRANRCGPLQEGFNNLCVSLDKIKTLLGNHRLTDRYLIALGKAEWENMKWTDQSIAEKKNIINSVDLVFSASATSEAHLRSRKRLLESGVNSSLLDCSDAHAFSDSSNKDRIGNCLTWIKADSSFQGLQHALHEYDHRVHIGNVPPKVMLVRAHRTKYIDSIAITKRPGSTLLESWFDADIPLSHDLVAVIGNKGGGKSALSDVIALAGATKNFSAFSFLNNKRFREPKGKYASHFEAAITWHDGNTSKRVLQDDPGAGEVERVKYLPQSYLESLCNELASGGSYAFDSELRKIIYTHVPEEERLGKFSLDELLQFKLSELEKEKKRLTVSLSSLNGDMAAVERQMNPAYKTNLEQLLQARINELRSLEQSPPETVADPDQSPEMAAANAASSARLSVLENEIAQVAQLEQAARSELTNATRALAHMSRIAQSIKNYGASHARFLDELDKMLKDAGVSEQLMAAEVVRLEIDEKRVIEVAKTFQSTKDANDQVLANVLEGGLQDRRLKAENEIVAIKSQLGEGQRAYQEYKVRLSSWEQAQAAIKGAEDKPQSIAWYNSELAKLELLPQKINDLRASREEFIRQLHGVLMSMVREYKLLYRPVQNFVQTQSTEGINLPLDFDVRISEVDFADNFLSRINRQARGSFSGVDESNLILRNLILETNFDDVEGVVSFVTEIEDKLHHDRRVSGEHSPITFVDDQMRKGQKAEELYDFLFGLEYLQPQYSLTYDGQEISQISPGERGLLLLVFYLLVDNDDIPLIIDQPEENLDNQTIFKVLVACIKEAKQKRQVIMVTHNPNLAVVCDAEQIVYASCDKSGRQFKYESGAIESPDIRKHVIAILEGTEPAFRNRKLKYRF